MAEHGSPRRRQRSLWRCGLVFLGLLAGPVLHAQSADSAERTGPVKIGALTQSWGPTPQMVGLRDGLQALGYREGEQFVIGVRFTQGDMATLPAAARDLVQSGVDVIFATDANAAKAAQLATNRIPIVFAAVVGDPVALGLVQSFARPGGNITGVTDTDLDLSAKRLEIFKEMIPGLTHVLFPYDPRDSYSAAGLRAYRAAARLLDVVLVEKPVQTEAEARTTLSMLRKGQVGGIIAPSSLSLNIPGVVLDATSKRAIPSMFNGAFFVEGGGLVSYGPDFYDSGRQAARLVDKIVKGEDPGRIPVEANPKIELAINMKVARALKLTIAPGVAQRANRLIP
jgi:putative tryptophan/tyrosine transport system substrate-binding protein